MNHNRITEPLAKALRFYAVLAAAIVIFQAIGLLMYLVNVWPSVRLMSPGGEPISTGVTIVLFAAVIMGFARSLLWIRIYWDGSRAFSLLRSDEDSPDLGDRLTPVLSNLTRLLILSGILDVLFLPAYFLSGAVLPFPIAGWRLGVVEVARIVFPQAFGIAALILAFLTHQYGQLLKERGRLKNELELTI
jgi:lysylphosphatidylglycerol synthetase-like protein (DUF2156 family)